MSLVAKAILLAVIVGVIVEGTFMGLGSGCGCGGGGGCGRKKREVLGQQIRTETDSPCPQSEWKILIEENLREDPESSKYAIQGAMFRHYEEKFFVACVDKSKQNLIDQLQFASNGEAYCQHGNKQIWCQVLALFG